MDGFPNIHGRVSETHREQKAPLRGGYTGFVPLREEVRIRKIMAIQGDDILQSLHLMFPCVSCSSAEISARGP